MQLTRARVIATAMELIETEGIEAASMRRLSAELGCGLIALYNLIPSGNGLLDAISDAMSAVESAPPPDASWPEQLRSQARALRAAARAHPRCALIAAGRPPASAAAVRPVEQALAALAAAGLRGPDAVRVVRTLIAFGAGTVLREAGILPGPDWRDPGEPAGPRLRASEFPRVTALAAELREQDPDGDFEFGLDLLIRSVAALTAPPAAA
jgi:AcrR family transcriptional regulator